MTSFARVKLRVVEGLHPEGRGGCGCSVFWEALLLYGRVSSAGLLRKTNASCVRAYELWLAGGSTGWQVGAGQGRAGRSERLPTGIWSDGIGVSSGPLFIMDRLAAANRVDCCWSGRVG